MESIEIAFAIVAIIGLGVAGVMVCGGWQVAKYASRMWLNRRQVQAR
ncbi:MAG: hypothetical protein IPK87_15465 [Planctomycetes bacterium]|nr:hypothetical protein [Planctomycetota bacterium]